MIKGHFEARKVAYRQTKDGVVVSFVIHPNDDHALLATAPLGIRLMIGYAEIGDDETTPTAPDSVEAPARTPYFGSKNPDPDKSERAKAQYASMDQMEQARVRASLMCKDWRFMDYVGVTSEEEAAKMMREALCIKSRSEIATNEHVYECFLAMETSYKQSIGQMAEERA